MIGASVRRGIAAGLVAGVLAGLVGLVLGEPALDRAIALEQAQLELSPMDAAGMSRGLQKAGLVLGSAIAGLGVGAVFGVAAAWAGGRVAGDAWDRSRKLAATVLGAVVLLPGLAFPPDPPGVGDPATIAFRTQLYLATVVIGLLLAVAAWTGARRLAATSLSRPLRQALVGIGVAAAATVVLLALPTVERDAAVPADLLWSFRLGALATSAVLFGGTGIVYGLLSSRGADS